MAADAITGAAGAGLLYGATPYQWANLGTGLLMGTSGVAKPAGPSDANSNPFFGAMSNPFDSSGWSVNFGDGATQTTKAGDRTGPVQTPTASAAMPGGYAASAGPNASASGGLGINPLYLLGAAALLLVIWKRS